MIARLSSRRQLVIPKSIATALRLNPGDLLDVVQKKNAVILTYILNNNHDMAQKTFFG